VEYLISYADDLDLDYFIIQNGNLPSKTTSASSTLPSNTTSNAHATLGPGTRRATSSGLMAGGIIGGVLVALSVFYLYRRRRKRGIEADEPIPFNPPAHVHPNPASRKPSFVPIDPGPHANAADLPQSNHNHNQMQTMKVASTSATNVLCSRDDGLLLRPTRLKPSSRQQDIVAVGHQQSSHVNRDASRDQDSGVESNGEILTTSIILGPPPQYEE
jgi:hypothetical protein